ncbi:CBS domain-containing protein [Neobacillus sp. Marseille-QA0830]
MFVKNMMIPKHECITVQVDATVKETLEKLEEHQIDGVPVLQGNQYVGVATRYNIYEKFFQINKPKEEYVNSTLVKEVVSHRDMFLQGAELFERTLLDLKDFPLLAVVDDNQSFLGVVTRSDVLGAFESAFGVNRPGIRIAFTSVETEGRIARLSEIAHHFHVHIISFVTFDETDRLVRRIVMKIEKKNNVDKFLKKLEEHGFRILSIQED